MLASFFLQWAPPKKNPLISPFRDGQPSVKRSKASPLCALETAWLDGAWTKGLAEGKTSIYLYYIYVCIHIYIHIVYTVQNITDVLMVDNGSFNLWLIMIMADLFI